MIRKNILFSLAGIILNSFTGCASYEHDLVQAKRGDAAAQYRIGLSYTKGTKKVGRDLPKGMMLLEKSATAGYSPAMFELGKLYLTDNTVLAHEKGVSWLRKADDAGHPDAERELGFAILNGEFTEYNSLLIPALRQAEASRDISTLRRIADAYALHFRGYIQKLHYANRVAEVDDFFQLVQGFCFRMKARVRASDFPEIRAVEAQLNGWAEKHPR